MDSEFVGIDGEVWGIPAFEGFVGIDGEVWGFSLVEGFVELELDWFCWDVFEDDGFVEGEDGL